MSRSSSCEPARILLLATTTGYQIRAFDGAAARLGIELMLGTDRCKGLDDPWHDRSVAVRFHRELASVNAIRAAVRGRPVAGVIAVGDRPTVLASRVAVGLDLPGNSPAAAAASRNKQLTRERFAAAGLPTPWFRTVPLEFDLDSLAASVPYPCVVKPLALSGSRGVMRADSPEAFRHAWARLAELLRRPDVRVLHDPALGRVMVERFIEGREYAIEGLLTHGQFTALAIFDKPDPLDGPFFEETLYLTPSALPPDRQRRLVTAVAAAIMAIGLRHGPIHAEARMAEDGEAVVLEVAARPIGGLCARALRFVADGEAGPISLEELLLRHAVGQDVTGWTREPEASGVMMIPIPARGIYQRVEGVEAASLVPGIAEVTITAKKGQLLEPLPEGASYLGFIFARGGTQADVERALRQAYRALAFTLQRPIPLLVSA